MYRKKKHWKEASFLDFDDLDVYNRWLIEEQVEDDMLAQGAVLKGYLEEDE